MNQTPSSAPYHSRKLMNDIRLHAIFGITLMAVMGVASITPAFPSISKTLDLSKTEIAWLISAFTFPGIFLSPVAGILADRLGRKTVVVPSLFLFGIAGSAIFFMHNYQLILALRVLQGIGAASLGSLNTTLIGDYFKGKQLPQAMGYNASVLSLATALYPLIGGILASITWYYPFLLPLLAIPTGLFVIMKLKEPDIDKSSTLKQYLKDSIFHIRKKETLAVFTLGIITFIILYGAFLTYFPFLLNDLFNFSPAQIGLCFALSSVTMAIVATKVGWLTTRFGSTNLLKVAFLLYVLVTFITPHFKNIYGIIFVVIIFGAAQALNIPSLHTMLAKLAPDRYRAMVMSLNGMMIRLGQTLGPLLIGIGYSAMELKGAFYLGALVGLMGLVVTFLLKKEENHQG